MLVTATVPVGMLATKLAHSVALCTGSVHVVHASSREGGGLLLNYEYRSHSDWQPLQALGKVTRCNGHVCLPLQIMRTVTVSVRSSHARRSTCLTLRCRASFQHLGLSKCKVSRRLQSIYHSKLGSTAYFLHHVSQRINGLLSGQKLPCLSCFALRARHPF